MATITFEVISDNREVLGEEATRTFDIAGGTIGRAFDNDWALPDPMRYISSRHARVLFENGKFFLEDISKNGVIIDDEKPLGRGNRVELSSVGVIRMGDYLIKVILSEEASSLNSQTLVGEPPEDLLEQADPLNFDLPSQPADDSPIGSASVGLEDILNGTPPDSEIPDPLLPDTPTLENQDFFHGTPSTDEPFIPPSSDSHRDPFAPFQEETPTPGPEQPDIEGSPEPGESFIPENWDLTGINPKVTLQSDPGARSSQKHGPVPTPPQAGEFAAGSQHSVADTAPANLVNDTQQPAATTEAAPENLEPPAPPEPSESPRHRVQSEAPAATTGSPSTPVTAVPVQSTAPGHASTSAQPVAPGQSSAGATAPPIAGAGSRAASAFQQAGIDTALLENPEFVDQWLAMLPSVMGGILDLLRSRATIKNEMRASKTTLQPVENNPLKFSLNEADAVHNLFISPRQGFLPADSAVEEAINDLKLHQVALINGVQGGLNALIKKLSPQAIEELAEQGQINKNIFGKVTGTSKWEAYRQAYANILENSSDSFLDVFAEDFVKAYETHIRAAKHKPKSD